MAKALHVLLTTWWDHPLSSCVEWVAHHRALGVSRIHVFMSKAKNPLPPLAAALVDAGLIEVSHIHTDPAEGAEQIRNAAIRAAELEAAETSGWGLFLAADEYLVLPKHDVLSDALSEFKGAHVISAPVRVFGPDMLERTHVPGGVLDGADHRSPDPSADGSGARNWRSLVKCGLWPIRVPAFPTGKPQTDLKRVNWRNGAGQPMPKPHGDYTFQRDPDAFAPDRMLIARVPVPSVETALLRLGYVDPRKSQPLAEDLTPDLKRAQGVKLADPALLRAAKARAAAMADILSDPSVRTAYDAQCAEEVARIVTQTRRHGVWRVVFRELGYKAQPDPSLDTAAPVQPDPSSVQIETQPADPTPDTVPDTVPAHDPAPAPAATSATIAAPVKVHARVPDEFARVATDPPPPWFAEIYPGGDRQGFLTRLENHALVQIDRDPDTLIVTFDNISNVNDISYGREPWAYRFVRAQGYSHFAVIARRKDWYRDKQLIDALQRLAADGHFARYKKVVMAGTSMGGFGALAFSSLAPGCTVLAYSPQTTLDSELVPWEERFDMGRERNWSLPHSDAAFEIEDASKVFVIYDPFFEPDKRHIERLEGDNVVVLKSWFAGHFSAVFIRRANLIKPLFQDVIDGTLTEARYYDLLRGRRHLAWYRKAMEERAVATGHPKLATLVGPAFQKMRRARQTAPAEA